MIFGRYSIALLGLIALQIVASPLELVSDMQTCIELCDKCAGTADFGDNVCQCHVLEDDQRGAECIGRIKRQAQELGLDVVSCDLASTEADRPARCILSSSRRFRSRDDADLIAKYFMENPLGGFSSLLGSGKSETDKSKDGSDSEKVASTNDDKREVGGDRSNSDSQIVGAANPLIAGQYVDFNPLIGLAPAWLHPQTLLSLGNGFNGLGSGSGTPGLVGAQNPNYGQMNYVGSPQPQSWDFYSPYPTDSMLGMSPYSYFVGAPNPIQYGDESFYGYNPSLVGNSYLGLSPYPSFPVETTDSQVGDPAPLPEGSLNKNAETVGESVQDSADSEPSLGDNKDAAFENGEENLESIREEDEEEREEPVVNSKRTADDTEADAAPLKEIKEQSFSRSKSKLKRRQSKLKSKAIPKER